jgi:hypothetical protein
VYHVDDEDNNQLSENDQGQDQFKGLLTAMNRWATVYDRALDHLQQMV